MNELALVCLRGANRSRLAALQATNNDDRAYWHHSAATWLAIFWRCVYGSYGVA
jgi:hypothetical protein